MDIWYDKAVGNTSYIRLLSHNGNSEKLQPSVMYMLVTTSSTAICKWDFCKKIWNCYKRMGCCLHPFRAVYHCWRRQILWYCNLFLNLKNVISSYPLKLIQYRVLFPIETNGDSGFSIFILLKMMMKTHIGSSILLSCKCI